MYHDSFPFTHILPQGLFTIHFPWIFVGKKEKSKAHIIPFCVLFSMSVFLQWNSLLFLWICTEFCIQQVFETTCAKPCNIFCLFSKIWVETIWLGREGDCCLIHELPLGPWLLFCAEWVTLKTFVFARESALRKMKRGMQQNHILLWFHYFLFSFFCKCILVPGGLI